MSESVLSIVPVPVKLARVNGPPAAVICSSSSDVSWRAPILPSTRLSLLFDIKLPLPVLGFLLQTSRMQLNLWNYAEQKPLRELLIEGIVRIVGCAGYKSGSKSELSPGNLFHFVVCELASTHPAE